ncbi:MAG: hypothetical protein FWE24_00615 [Defluviitaleaceae bacterium]|nr:hypothetical protein [Defluviitaleaceae bacterium]
MRSDEHDSAGLEAKTQCEQLTTYKEHKIGKTLYCTTSIYKGEINLAKALEDLTVRRILRHENNENNF